MIRRRARLLEVGLLAVSRVEDGLGRVGARLRRWTLDPASAARRALHVALVQERFPELVPGALVVLGAERWRLVRGPFWCPETDRVEVKAVRLDDLDVWTHLTPGLAREGLVAAWAPAGTVQGDA